MEIEKHKKEEHEKRTEGYLEKYKCPGCGNTKFKTDLQVGVTVLTCKICGEVQKVDPEELMRCTKDYLRPEVKAIVKHALENSWTTKHGYGTILAIMGDMQTEAEKRIFLVVCVEEGYPLETALQIEEIMGWK